jgi:TRAP transporter TAXI family solute receptor
MSSTSRALALAASVAILPGACTGTAVRDSENPRQGTAVVIAAGSVGSDYYPLGGAVCRLVNLETARHGIRCRTATSPGSVFNVTALREGRFDLAVLPSDVQHDAVTGGGPFARQRPFTSLRAVLSAHAEPFALVVRNDSGIETAADLLGRRVNIGDAGSGHRLAMERVMEALGPTRAHFALVTELPPREQNDALCEGRVDAVVYAAGHPNGIVQDAIRRCGGRLVAMSGPPVEALLASHPEYTRAVIPAGLYPGHPVDIPTFGARATLVTTAAAPGDVVYEIARAVLERFDDFLRLHASFAPLDPREMVHAANRAPLHPGAELYYRERGWLP